MTAATRGLGTPQAPLARGQGGTVPPALAALGLRVLETAMNDNRHLLSLLRRTLKMTDAFIVEKNANLAIFEVSSLSGNLSSAISDDVRTDPRVLASVVTRFENTICRYAGFSLSVGAVQRDTLVLVSSSPGSFTSADMATVQEVLGLMEDRYAARVDCAVSGGTETLSTCGVLLSGLETHLRAATILASSIRDDFLRCEQSRRTAIHLQEQCERLGLVLQRLSESMDRIVTIAQSFSAPDAKKYYRSCLQHMGDDFVDNFSQALVELSRLTPEHRLSWSFRIDSELVRCSNRAFYPHLLFFLEGLMQRWSACCSAAHVEVTYDSHRRSPEHALARSDLGYLSVTFQPTQLFEVGTHFAPAVESSEQLVGVLDDFLRRTDRQSGAVVEDRLLCCSFATEAADGASYGALIGYTITVPCIFTFEAPASPGSTRTTHSKAPSHRGGQPKSLAASISTQSIDELVHMKRLSMAPSDRNAKLVADIACAVEEVCDRGRGPSRRSVALNDLQLTAIAVLDSAPPSTRTAQPRRKSKVADESLINGGSREHALSAAVHTLVAVKPARRRGLVHRLISAVGRLLGQ